MFRALLGMPLIHKNSRNIFLQKLPILLHSNCFLQGKIAKARQCINRAIFEEKYFLYFRPPRALGGLKISMLLRYLVLGFGFFGYCALTRVPIGSIGSYGVPIGS